MDIAQGSTQVAAMGECSVPATQLQWPCQQCIHRPISFLVLEESLLGPPQHQRWSLAWLLTVCLLVDCLICLHPKKQFLDWLECRQGLLPSYSLSDIGLDYYGWDCINHRSNGRILQAMVGNSDPIACLAILC